MYAAHITLNINVLHLPPLLRVYKVYALFLVVMFHFHNFANVIKLLIFKYEETDFHIIINDIGKLFWPRLSES